LRTIAVHAGRPRSIGHRGAAPRAGACGPGDLARDHQIFTGKLVKKHLSFPDRVIASATRVQEGDFRNWDDIRAWATSIADTLLAS